MNRELVKEIILSLVIVLSQLLIFNHINLFGTVDTFIYVSLFILYKTTYNKTYLILFGFLVGLIIDLSLQTYGAHILASITVCYLKGRIEKYSFGVNSTLPLAMIRGTQLTNRATYFFLISAYVCKNYSRRYNMYLSWSLFDVQYHFPLSYVGYSKWYNRLLSQRSYW